MRRLAVLIFLIFAASLFANPVVPVLSSRYTGDEQLLQAIKDLKAEIALFRLEIAQLRTGPKQVVPLPVPINFNQLVGNRCAGCHGEAVAEEKGAGFVMLLKDGTTPEFSVREKARILREVKAERMPKGKPPLSEVELSVIGKYLFPE